MKLIIAGSRDYHNYGEAETLINAFLDTYWDQNKDLEIVSGCALGADALGERYAERFSISVAKFPAKWKQHGKAAGPIRNEQMAKYADALIAFWDMESPGTKDMIKKAKKYNLEPIIVKII